MKKVQRLLSIRQVHEEYLTGISERMIYLLVQRGELRTERCGRKLLVSEQAVQDFVNGLMNNVNLEK